MDAAFDCLGVGIRFNRKENGSVMGRFQQVGRGRGGEGEEKEGFDFFQEQDKAHKGKDTTCEFKSDRMYAVGSREYHVSRTPWR